MIRFKCPNRKNVVAETANEGDDQLMTRFTRIHRIGDNRRVQCRKCGAWVWVPKNIF